ncbi:MAG: primosomal protein N' [Pseudomonadota bacterium]
MDAKKKFAEVAVPLHIEGLFHYEVPETLQERIEKGHRVWVPFGNKEISAYVVDFIETSQHPSLKKIIGILDDRPLFPADMIPFFIWISQYYLCPLGEVIKTALPSEMAASSTESIVITEEGIQALQSRELANAEKKALAILAQQQTATYKELKAKASNLTRSILSNMAASGLILISQKIRQSKVLPKLEWYVSLQQGCLSTSSVISKNRQKILDILSGMPDMSLSQLKKHVPSASSVLIKKLAEAGLVHMTQRPVYRDPFGDIIECDCILPELNDEQKAAVSTIETDLHKEMFSVFLLHGVTGSGKTEVYLRAVAQTLKQHKTALVLVPEIALISQTEHRFRARFGEHIAVLHSGLTEGERYDQWMRILQNEAQVVIGARSAIFAPLKRLGLVVVDEEHDDSYKQESGLRYHGRDLAVMRAKLAGAVSLLGSATPSLSSYYNTITGKYQKLVLASRVHKQPLPHITVVDLRQMRESRPKTWFLGSELKKEIDLTLSRGEQALLFLNRRGYASFPICSQCGKAFKCKNCDVTLTFHQGANILRCHYCGFSQEHGCACATCGSKKISLLGLGTEQLETTLKEIFPNARIARMDRDTTSKKGELVKQLQSLRDGSIDIMIGTQMIAKGHDFPNITMVGIVCADMSLNFPDLRAVERTFQILSQVAGRAGRRNQIGRVILQTYNPEHFCMKTAKNQDYEEFYKQESSMRKELGYPPFSRLIQVTVSGENPESVLKASHTLAQFCDNMRKEDECLKAGTSVLGPVPAPIFKLQKKYRSHMLIKGANPDVLHQIAHRLIVESERIFKKGKKRISVMVDVDPVTTL